MSKEAIDRIRDWVLWYEEHKNTDMSVKNKIKFLTKAIDGLFELILIHAADIKEIEGTTGKGGKLLLPPEVFRRLINH